MDQNEIGRTGSWRAEEDRRLRDYVNEHGVGRWKDAAPKLGRTAKSCRDRWINYLSPKVRRGNISDEEMLSVLLLHFKWGSKWAKIAKELLPAGRTDNEIKNFWNTQIKNEAKKRNQDADSFEFLETMTRELVERIDVAGLSRTVYSELKKLFPAAVGADTSAATFSTANGAVESPFGPLWSPVDPDPMWSPRITIILNLAVVFGIDIEGSFYHLDLSISVSVPVPVICNFSGCLEVS